MVLRKFLIIGVTFLSFLLGHYSSGHYLIIDDRGNAFETNKQFAPSPNFLDLSPTENHGCFPCGSHVFSFVPKDNVASAVFSGDASLLSKKISDDKVEFCLNDFLTEGRLDFHFDGADGAEMFYTYYYVKPKSADKVYFSNISFDDAKRLAGIDLSYGFHFPSTEGLENHISTTSASGLSASNLGKVYGNLKFTDEEGDEYPLYGATVSLAIDDSSTLKTTTNSNGYYEICYSFVAASSNLNPVVSVTLENDLIYAESYTGGIYELTHPLDRLGGETEFSYTFSTLKDGDMGAASMVFQGTYLFANVAKSQTYGDLLTRCGVVYPYDYSDGISEPPSSYYLSSLNKFYMPSTIYKPISVFPSSYASWDVVGHEFAHHLEKCLGITLGVGGSHGPSTNLIDQLYSDNSNPYYYMNLTNAKTGGTALAWSEGFATFWSISAQEYFPEVYKNIRYVGDSHYMAYNFLGFDLVSDSTPYTHGDADEMTVLRILYQLAMQTSVFAGMDFNYICDLIVENQCLSFSDFVNAVYSVGLDPFYLADLLATYHVIPGEMIITDNLIDEVPSFTWSTSLGSDYLFFDSFDVYLECGTLTIVKRNVRSSGESVTFTPADDVWESICSEPLSEFSVYFVAKQTLGTVSGGYFSEKFTFPKPSSYSDDFVHIKASDLNDAISSSESSDSTVLEYGSTSVLVEWKSVTIESGYLIFHPGFGSGNGISRISFTFDHPIFSLVYSLNTYDTNGRQATGSLKVGMQNGTEFTIRNLFYGGVPNVSEGPNRVFLEVTLENVNKISFELSGMTLPLFTTASYCMNDLAVGLTREAIKCFYLNYGIL